MIKDFEMRRLFWIIKVSYKCNCMCLYKMEAEGGSIQTGGYNVIIEAKTEVLQSLAKLCQQPAETIRRKERNLSQESLEVG